MPDKTYDPHLVVLTEARIARGLAAKQEDEKVYLVFMRRYDPQLMQTLLDLDLAHREERIDALKYAAARLSAYEAAMGAKLPVDVAQLYGLKPAAEKGAKNKGKKKGKK